MTPCDRGVFVSGTDTGVGKTVVSCALVRGLRAAGLSVAAMKPIETGVGDEGPLDAMLLRDAAGAGDDLHDVCPVQLALAAAPTVAADGEGARIELRAIDAAFDRLCAGRDFAVVEGAGGLLVPALAGATMADLALHLGLPVLLVVRSALGTINHTRLSLEAVESRGLCLAGVVVSHADGPLSGADAANLSALRGELGTRLIGEVPPLGPGVQPASDAIDLGPLLAAAKRLEPRPIRSR